MAITSTLAMLDSSATSKGWNGARRTTRSSPPSAQSRAAEIDGTSAGGGTLATEAAPRVTRAASAPKAALACSAATSMALVTSSLADTAPRNAASWSAALDPPCSSAAVVAASTLMSRRIVQIGVNRRKGCGRAFPEMARPGHPGVVISASP